MTTIGEDMEDSNVGEHTRPQDLWAAALHSFITDLLHSCVIGILITTATLYKQLRNYFC